jgi:AraC-like DNA-binding protein
MSHKIQISNPDTARCVISLPWKVASRTAGSLSPLQVGRVCDYIGVHLDCELEVAQLAKQVNLSPHHFSMLFKRATGVPPHQYVLHKRIEEAKHHLAAGRLTLSEVALSLGFSDQSHFSRAFRKITGSTPRQYVLLARQRSIMAPAATSCVTQSPSSNRLPPLSP